MACTSRWICRLSGPTRANARRRNNPVTPANNHVLGLPTIQVYKDGELVKSFKGAKSKSTLLGAIEEYL